jgi:hypothetical protein
MMDMVLVCFCFTLGEYFYTGMSSTNFASCYLYYGVWAAKSVSRRQARLTTKLRDCINVEPVVTKSSLGRYSSRPKLHRLRL